MTRSVGTVLLLLAVVAVAAGCGSKKKQTSPLPKTKVLAPAQSPDEWAARVVNRVLRPTNRDIRTLLALNNPQTKVYIQERNENTIRILNANIPDLGRCSGRLIEIGPPPPTADDLDRLNRIDALLHRACRHYGKVSEIVLDAVGLMSSEKSSDHLKGLRRLGNARTDAFAAAGAYDRAVTLAQRSPEFRRQGIKPPS